MELYQRLQKWLRDDEGQGLVEYALIIALIAIVVVAVFPALSAALAGVFNQITGSFGS